VEGGQILRSLLRVLLASAVMGLAVAGVLTWTQGNGYGALVQLLAGGLVGVAVYVVAGLLFGVQELRRLPAALFGR
jgi:Na+/proline symporter